MNVLVNGETMAVDSETTVADIVVSSGKEPSGRGVAVALNGEVVPRDEWATRKLSERDSVEVLAAIGGG